MGRGKAYVILFMAGVALFFGAAVSGLYLVSRDTVERNRETLTRRSYIRLFDMGDPAAMSPREVMDLVERRVDTGGSVTHPDTGEKIPLITAYADDARQVVKSYGFPFRGLGFWAPIEGIVALTPDLTTTIGIVILEQKETPGLGGRIEEPIFTDQFRKGIYVAPPADGKGPCIRISSSKPSAAEAARRHVDAISGATQTCLAMDRILNDSLMAFGRAMAEKPAGTKAGE